MEEEGRGWADGRMDYAARCVPLPSVSNKVAYTVDWARGALFGLRGGWWGTVMGYGQRLVYSFFLSFLLVPRSLLKMLSPYMLSIYLFPLTRKLPPSLPSPLSPSRIIFSIFLVPGLVFFRCTVFHRLVDRNKPSPSPPLPPPIFQLPS